MTKRLIFCLFLCSWYLQASAQLNEGTFWLGGNINFGSSIVKVNGIQEPQALDKDLAIQPYFGKAIDKSTVVGINLAYRRSKENYTGPSGRIANEDDYGGGVFYRKYKALGKGFYFYANAEVNYTYATTSFVRVPDPSDFQKSKINNIVLLAYPGLSYSLKENIFLEVRTGDLIGIYYRAEKKHIEFPINNKRDERYRTFSVSSSFNNLFNNFGLGFRFLLK